MWIKDYDGGIENEYYKGLLRRFIILVLTQLNEKWLNEATLMVNSEIVELM